MLNIKRIYDEPDQSDGYRVLVDRLWPRGVSQDNAALDFWLKDVAPSPDLRQWFDHDPARFEEFRSRYENELASNPFFVELQKIVRDKPKVTLLYAAKDPAVNHAVVLKEYLARKTRRKTT